MHGIAKAPGVQEEKPGDGDHQVTPLHPPQQRSEEQERNGG